MTEYALRGTCMNLTLARKASRHQRGNQKTLIEKRRIVQLKKETDEETSSGPQNTTQKS